MVAKPRRTDFSRGQCHERMNRSVPWMSRWRCKAGRARTMQQHRITGRNGLGYLSDRPVGGCDEYGIDVRRRARDRGFTRQQINL